MSAVPLTRRRHASTVRVIDEWQRLGVVDDALAARLARATTVVPFDWQRAARHAFLAATLCIVIAIGSVLADRALIALLMRLFDAPAAAKSVFFVIVAAIVFRVALRARARRPERVHHNEAIFFLGVLALAAAVAFFGVAIDDGSGHVAVLFLIATVAYASLGRAFQSPLVWIFALVSLGAWMGTETWYASGHGAYFLGMNQPLRFVVFGASMTLLGIAGEHAAPRRGIARLVALSVQTKVVGLLYLFVALWILSIFGNYGDLGRWARVGQSELFGWSLLFGAAAVAAVVHGLRRDDAVVRGFGLTFFFIGLYTRFFEYGWNTMHKAAFFAVLAASFWMIGRYAETVWTLGRRDRP